MTIDQRFHSLEDYLASSMSSVDGVVDDGYGFGFPVKGREINATVLFADISAFSTRTMKLSPAQTLVFAQNFFAWVSEEALRGHPGIVDKYIGDEVMVVFSKEFGSEDPIVDAIQAAAAMSRRDVHAYRPHIGIASGPMIVGYAGTALRYNVSIFGAPVALAARCAAVKPADPNAVVSSTIVMPATDWGNRELDEVLPLQSTKQSDGSVSTESRIFDLLGTREVEMKGIGRVEIREIHNTSAWFPTQSAEMRAIESMEHLRRQGRYWPRVQSKDTSSE